MCDLNADENALAALDEELVSVLFEIEKLYGDYPKYLQVRVERWVEKIAERTNNLIWKKNNNAYALLLLEMIRRRKFKEPFDRLPPNGTLRMLAPHLWKLLASEKPVNLRQKKAMWTSIYERLAFRINNRARSHAYSMNEREEASPILANSIDDSLFSPNRSKIRYQKKGAHHSNQHNNRNLAFVEVTNRAFEDLKHSYFSEKDQREDAESMIEEMKVLLRGQMETIDSLELERDELKKAFMRELEELKEVHQIELTKLTNRHEKRMENLRLDNEVKLAMYQAETRIRNIFSSPDETTKPAQRNHTEKENVIDFLDYIHQFQHEPVKTKNGESSSNRAEL